MKPLDEKALAERLERIRAFAQDILDTGHDRTVIGSAMTIRDEVDAIRAYMAALDPAPGWMPIETVYVVGGTVGEWSDRSEWTVGVWVCETDAKAFVEKIGALGRVFEQAIQKRNDDDWSDESEAAVVTAEAECRAVDPGWSDYCGDAPRYTVWPEKLILPAAPMSQEG